MLDKCLSARRFLWRSNRVARDDLSRGEAPLTRDLSQDTFQPDNHTLGAIVIDVL